MIGGFRLVAMSTRNIEAMLVGGVTFLPLMSKREKMLVKYNDRMKGHSKGEQDR